MKLAGGQTKLDRKFCGVCMHSFCKRSHSQQKRVGSFKPRVELPESKHGTFYSSSYHFMTFNVSLAILRTRQFIALTLDREDSAFSIERPDWSNICRSPSCARHPWDFLERMPDDRSDANRPAVSGISLEMHSKNVRTDYLTKNLLTPDFFQLGVEKLQKRLVRIATSDLTLLKHVSATANFMKHTSGISDI